HRHVRAGRRAPPTPREPRRSGALNLASTLLLALVLLLLVALFLVALLLLLALVLARLALAGLVAVLQVARCLACALHLHRLLAVLRLVAEREGGGTTRAESVAVAEMGRNRPAGDADGHERMLLRDRK